MPLFFEEASPRHVGRTKPLLNRATKCHRWCPPPMHHSCAPHSTLSMNATREMKTAKEALGPKAQKSLPAQPKLVRRFPPAIPFVSCQRSLLRAATGASQSFEGNPAKEHRSRRPSVSRDHVKMVPWRGIYSWNTYMSQCVLCTTREGRLAGDQMVGVTASQTANGLSFHRQSIG